MRRQFGEDGLKGELARDLEGEASAQPNGPGGQCHCTDCRDVTIFDGNLILIRLLWSSRSA